MNDKQVARLLEKYLDGRCTPEEAQVVNAWYQRSGKDSHIVELLPDAKRAQLKKEMLCEILHRTQKSAERPYTVQRTWWWKVSAAAVLLILIGLGYQQYSTKTQIHNLDGDLQVFNSGKGILKQVLPDSSVVWLNPGASIHFPRIFHSKSREVAMNGECFFEVVKNPDRPFIIRSSHLLTKVWGTSFKVSDYSVRETARVSVASGKVSVSVRGGAGERAGTDLHQDEVILKANDDVRFDKAVQGLRASRNVRLLELGRYKPLSLTFENTSLQDIAHKLSSNFNIQIRIANDQLASHVMDADLTELNLPEILEVLQASMPLKYEITNDVVVLRPTN